MKVHFACTTAELRSHKEDYRKICQIIRNKGHIISRDWIEEAIKFSDNKKKKLLNREDIYKEITASIYSSDVLIVEATVPSFSVGHQISLGLSKNKPTLCLVKKEKKQVFSGKRKLGGIVSPFLQIEEYDDANLEGILTKFLSKSVKNSLIKFNIVLTKEIENYLDWVSFTKKINKSEFIRDLILSKIRNDEKDYKKFLS